MEAQIAVPEESRTFTVPVPLAMLGDEKLARQVGQGNERAFSALYSRYHQQLYRYCHSLVRHEADAQDALQSTFTAALSALRRGQRDAPLRPWLYRIAHNESISLLRRRRVADELPETMEAPGTSVEHAVEERAQLALLVSDLQALPERQRGALVMRELSGLSHEDVAQALGISVGAAKQTVFEARQALQEFSEGRAMPCNDIRRVISDGDRRALRGRRVRAHLRECSGCQSFSEAIPERRAALMALSPALPAAAAAGLLGRLTGTAARSAHHGGGMLAGATGKTVGIAVSAKTVATGIAIVATAGAFGAAEVVTHSHHASVPASLIHRIGTHGASSGHHGRSASGHGHAAAAGARGHHAGTGHAGNLAASSHGGRHGSGAGAAHRMGTLPSGTYGHQGGNSLQNPNAHGGNPNAQGGNGSGSANTGGTNPNAHGGNPNARGGHSSGSANAGGTNPNAHGGNPNAAGGNPNAGGGNLNPGTSNPNAHGGNPNAHGGNPNAGGGNPNANGGGSSGSGALNSHGGNPNAGGATSNAGGGNSTGSGKNSHSISGS